jgi:hypothetical protein
MCTGEATTDQRKLPPRNIGRMPNPFCGMSDSSSDWLEVRQDIQHLHGIADRTLNIQHYVGMDLCARGPRSSLVESIAVCGDFLTP